jgi:hypothetical protein
MGLVKKVRAIALATVLWALTLPAGASAAEATFGPDLDKPADAYTIGTHVFRVVGNVDGTDSFYAPISGYLTQVRVAHFGVAADLRILVFRRELAPHADQYRVIAVSDLMSLPAAPTPGVISTHPISTQTPIMAGDRIGLQRVDTAGGSIHFQGDTTTTSAPGADPSLAPTADASVDDVFTMVDDVNGPLMQGTISDTLPSPPNPGMQPPPPVPIPEPPAELSQATVKTDKKQKVHLPITCRPLGVLHIGCVGTVEIDGSPPATSSAGARAAKFKRYGKASFSIPEGETRIVKVKLNKAAKKKLRKKGKLLAYAVITMQVSGQQLSSQQRIKIRGKKAKKAR